MDFPPDFDPKKYAEKMGLPYVCIPLPDEPIENTGNLCVSSMEITYAADDVSTIRSRMKEIEEERAQVRRNQDPALACGEHLDRVAESWGEKRLTPGESDYTLRQRLLERIKGA